MPPGADQTMLNCNPSLCNWSQFHVPSACSQPPSGHWPVGLLCTANTSPTNTSCVPACVSQCTCMCALPCVVGPQSSIRQLCEDIHFIKETRDHNIKALMRHIMPFAALWPALGLVCSQAVSGLEEQAADLVIGESRGGCEGVKGHVCLRAADQHNRYAVKDCNGTPRTIICRAYSNSYCCL